MFESTKRALEKIKTVKLSNLSEVDPLSKQGLIYLELSPPNGSCQATLNEFSILLGLHGVHGLYYAKKPEEKITDENKKPGRIW